jgi:Domain of unknown function (DUF4118)
MSAESLVKSGTEVVVSANPIAVSSSVDLSSVCINSMQIEIGNLANSPVPAEVPFADFIGRCFMCACLCAEVLASWVRGKQVLPNGRAVAETSRGVRPGAWIRPSLGAACCTLAAACLTPLFSGTSLDSFLPFIFLLVIIYVALRFGDIAGVVGTVFAALIFEIFLFRPTYSFAIESSSARYHLMFMIILGICLSELVGRRKLPVVYKRW